MDCLRMHGRETEKGTHAPLSFTSLILSRARRRKVHAKCAASQFSQTRNVRGSPVNYLGTNCQGLACLQQYAY
jgi:hypothetical protein